MTNRIALVIKGSFDEPFTAHYASSESGFTDDDQLLVNELAHRGHQVSGLPWDKADVDWNSYDLVLIRSTWDFLFRKDEFRQWLDRMESKKVRLFNPVSVVCGNISKRYLLRLNQEGVTTIPTLLVEKGSKVSLTDVAASQGWEELVIKPASFGGAYKAERGTKEMFGELTRSAVEILQTDDLIIQRFQPEILTAGEWSFIFFDKAFSHAVRKVPRVGEWREQAQYGGAAVRDVPSTELVNQARKARDVLGEGTLFCRVDGIESAGKLYVNEVEMIDARLFFAADPDAACRCSNAIEAIISSLS
jgi:glutathione synthase/RimK-type ligase-like ATP-grasp enzyme